MQTSTHIRLSEGGYFDYAHPELSVFSIFEVAHSLARLCRFAGHVSVPHYSVAQHSVLVSLNVPPEDAFPALLHDAAEAFMVDIPSPLKQLLPDYVRLEHIVEQEIAKRWGLPRSLPPSVKKADHILLLTEQRDLTAGGLARSNETSYPPLPETIEALSAEASEGYFLARFFALVARCPQKK